MSMVWRRGESADKVRIVEWIEGWERRDRRREVRVEGVMDVSVVVVVGEERLVVRRRSGASRRRWV